MNNFKYENLKEIHKASIIRIYGERGNEILEGLRKMSTIAIPIVMKRLKQKDEEWRNSRYDLNKFWMGIYEKNYNKTFEVRSMEFKNAEKNKLNEKYLLNNIEELSKYDKNMSFNMNNLIIHKYIFQLFLKTLNFNDLEKEKFFYFYSNFLLKFFNLKNFNLNINEFLNNEEKIIKKKNEEEINIIKENLNNKEEEINIKENLNNKEEININLNNKEEEINFKENLNKEEEIIENKKKKERNHHLKEEGKEEEEEEINEGEPKKKKIKLNNNEKILNENKEIKEENIKKEEINYFTPIIEQEIINIKKKKI
jgi:histone deacetylase complex regulatory component SIN3